MRKIGRASGKKKLRRKASPLRRNFKTEPKSPESYLSDSKLSRDSQDFVEESLKSQKEKIGSRKIFLKEKSAKELLEENIDTELEGIDKQFEKLRALMEQARKEEQEYENN